MLALPAWYEVLDTVCVAALWSCAAVVLWVLVDRRSSGPAFLRTQWRRPGVAQVFFAILGLVALFVVAEDVLEGHPDELIVMLDATARDWFKAAATSPSVLSIAQTVSQCTGAGLATGVVVATACLAGTRRSRDAILFAAGTASAWALGGLLKFVFAVPRPGSIHRYGFPSGHTLVTLVAAGLLIHILAGAASGRTRYALYAVAVGVAMLSGASRLVLGVHWVSDVVAGIAVGTVWLAVVTFGDARGHGTPARDVVPPAPLRPRVPSTASFSIFGRERRQIAV